MLTTAIDFVGFWLSYTLPTICYLLCPLLLIFFKKHYKLSPPTGSVMGRAAKLIRFAFKKSTKKNCFKDQGFWERIKPSSIRARGEAPPPWMTFDDAWVDEVRRGVIACKVFLWYPLYCEFPRFTLAPPLFFAIFVSHLASSSYFVRLPID
jgi:POT family proton-dependent oligopeptide transporter